MLLASMKAKAMQSNQLATYYVFNMTWSNSHGGIKKDLSMFSLLGMRGYCDMHRVTDSRAAEPSMPTSPVPTAQWNFGPPVSHSQDQYHHSPFHNVLYE